MDRSKAIEKRKGVSVILFHQGMVLGVSRKHDANDFGLVGGKVDAGETFEQAAIREAKEETGLDIFGLQQVFEREDGEYWVRAYVAQWKGEIQTTEKGVVKWITFEELKKGSFGAYNTQLEIELKQNGFFN